MAVPSQINLFAVRQRLGNRAGRPGLNLSSVEDPVAFRQQTLAAVRTDCEYLPYYCFDDPGYAAHILFPSILFTPNSSIAQA